MALLNVAFRVNCVSVFSGDNLSELFTTRPGAIELLNTPLGSQLVQVQLKSGNGVCVRLHFVILSFHRSRRRRRPDVTSVDKLASTLLAAGFFCPALLVRWDFYVGLTVVWLVSRSSIRPQLIWSFTFDEI